MDLTSDHPFWTLKNGLLADFPPLASDQSCDIIVLGAGITGACVAEALTADGHDVIIVDACDVGHGSTSASTALLQYEVDTHLIDLIKLHGPDHARMAYQACYESIDILEEKIRSLGLEDCAFTRKPSVYLASVKGHVPILREESEARRAIGIEVEDWGESDVKSLLGFSRPGALCSAQAAEVDAYRLTIGLLKTVARRGGRIFDRTRVTRLDIDKSGVLVRTDRSSTIRAKRVIVAMGYQTQTLFDTASCVNLQSSFAAASEPLEEYQRWWKSCLLWESARPYFYLRTEAGGRAIMGGEDVPFRNATARDKLIPRKSARLADRFNGMFPESGMEISHSWAGTFGETHDGLAFIGPYRKHPLCLFALGFGGNGITYSVTAAEILRQEVRGHRHDYSPVFHFDRR
ncbi:FAD-binding oxidoreductase [Luteolibacter yonseiensis]|uniref:FAD-binding oxidoreductase n=1 Tax=Luteolibacter yonseiensis TaxID=1144680 RepID=A0A934VBS3_9BACT|nr:FAD-binding oxidoreductase [Luteolibacter yonseiensis]MBK1817583.1 FAD-binding oxidoreductase [Luteolibacter yonseiensis]